MAQSENVFYKLRMSYKENGSPVSLRRLEALFSKRISFPHISELENGATPSSNQLKVYHDFFNVSYEYLLGEDTTQNYDTFHKHMEVVNTVEYISNSTDEVDQIIKGLVNELLTTDRGYAILFYLSEYLKNDRYSHEDMAHILEELKHTDIGSEYNDIRRTIENTLKKR